MQTAVEAAGETGPGRAAAGRAHPGAGLGNGGQSRGGRPRPGPEDRPRAPAPAAGPPVSRPFAADRHHGRHARKRRRQAAPRGGLNILDEGGRGGRGRTAGRSAGRQAMAGLPGGRDALPGKYGYLEFRYAYSELFGGQFSPQVSLSRLA